MSTSELQKKAQDLVGESSENDRLKIEDHVKDLREGAKFLIKLLQSTPVQSVYKEFNTWDDKALQTQAKFYTWSNIARWSVFLTACSSALLIGSSGLLEIFSGESISETDSPSFLVVVLMVLSIFFGVSASVCFNILRTKNLLTKWLQYRASAEETRLQLFDQIVSYDFEKMLDTDKQLFSLLKLEYFRRYQLDLQHNYYSSKSEIHGNKANRLLTFSALSMGGVALINGVVGSFGIHAPEWTSFAALAIILQAISNMVSSKEKIDENQRNAERYERTSIELGRLNGKLEMVREGISRGKLELATSFAKAVNELISVEHRQWISTLENRQTALNELEARLMEYEKDK